MIRSPEDLVDTIRKQNESDFQQLRRAAGTMTISDLETLVEGLRKMQSIAMEALSTRYITTIRAVAGEKGVA